MCARQPRIRGATVPESKRLRLPRPASGRHRGLPPRPVGETDGVEGGDQLAERGPGRTHIRVKYRKGVAMVRRAVWLAFVAIAVLLLWVLTLLATSMTFDKELLEAAKGESDTLSQAIEAQASALEKLPTADPDLLRILPAVDAIVVATEKLQGASPPKEFVALKAEYDGIRGSVLSAVAKREVDRQRMLALLTAALRKSVGTATAFDRLLDRSDTGYMMVAVGAKELSPYLLIWLLLFFVLAYLAFFPPTTEKLAGVLNSVSSIKLGGAEVVLSKQLKRDATEVIEAFREKVTATLDALSKKHRVWVRFKKVLNSHEVRTAVGAQNVAAIPGFRATLHVPDVLFSQTLYQLTDYYPDRHEGHQSTRGATKSIRFGIIGLSWRRCRSEKATVQSDAEVLIKDWGMTRAEANRATGGEGPKAVSATLLLDPSSGERIAVLYMDASHADAFGDSPQFHQAIERACRRCGLTKAVAALVESSKGAAPLIPTQ